MSHEESPIFEQEAGYKLRGTAVGLPNYKGGPIGNYIITDPQGSYIPLWIFDKYEAALEKFKQLVSSQEVIE